MQCQQQDCLMRAEYICDFCESQNIFCPNHCRIHSKKFNHSVKFIDTEELELQFKKSIEEKLNSCIKSITDDTMLIIKILKEAASNAIKKLKEMNRNLDLHSEFNKFEFDRNRINFLKEQVSLIASPMNNPNESKTQVIMDNLIPLNVHQSIQDLQTKVQSLIYLAFRVLGLEQRRLFVKSTWGHDCSSSGIQELLISNSGDYLFMCN